MMKEKQARKLLQKKVHKVRKYIPAIMRVYGGKDISFSCDSPTFKSISKIMTEHDNTFAVNEVKLEKDTFIIVLVDSNCINVTIQITECDEIYSISENKPLILE